MRNIVFETQELVWKAINPTAEPFEVIFGKWNERKEDAMKYTLRFAAIVAALMLAVACLIPSGSAEAAPLSAGVTSAAPSCSLPYVEDVQQSGKGYVALVSCAGSGSHFDIKVKCGSKKVKAERIDERTWSFKLKAGKTYKVSVRADGGSWKTIKYGIC